MKPKTAQNGPEIDVLQPRQEAAALAIASGCTLREAASESGAGQRTIKTWSSTLPSFGRRIAELRAEMTSRALGRLVDGMLSAAATLVHLSCKGKSEMVRLSAARSVVELARSCARALTWRNVSPRSKAGDSHGGSLESQSAEPA